jgi:GNAT superfamily N-acetyltransferase
MRLDDARRVHEIATRAFTDLDLRLGFPPSPSYASPEGEQRGLRRIRHLVTTDPGGAHLAERGGVPVGAALASLREGLWGLSLLVVDPAAQSGGVGTALMRAATDYGKQARGGIILASEDSRALRAYARAGFALHPSLGAKGTPRRLSSPSTVRAGGRRDLALAERVDRVVRGAGHGPDLGAMMDGGSQLLVVEDRGYALATGGELRLLAAVDPPSAQDLLRAVVARTPAGEQAWVQWVTSHQDWALDVLVESGLELKVGGAVALRGDVGRFRPYLPNGAYL